MINIVLTTTRWYEQGLRDTENIHDFNVVAEACSGGRGGCPRTSARRCAVGYRMPELAG